jgi:hypothetical protein
MLYYFHQFNGILRPCLHTIFIKQHKKRVVVLLKTWFKIGLCFQHISKDGQSLLSKPTQVLFSEEPTVTQGRKIIQCKRLILPLVLLQQEAAQ